MSDLPMSPSRNLHQRINAVMQEVTYIQKEKKSGMRYSIVSHDAVTAKIRPSFVNHGIVYYPYQLELKQSGNRTEATMYVRFVNIDDPDDFITVASAGYGIDDQDKGPGKAISYAVKYALLKALGLESGDEPDEDQETEYLPPRLTDVERNIALAESEDELAAVTKDLRALVTEKVITQAQFQSTGTKIKMRAKALGIQPKPRQQEAADAATQ